MIPSLTEYPHNSYKKWRIWAPRLHNNASLIQFFRYNFWKIKNLPISVLHFKVFVPVMDQKIVLWLHLWQWFSGKYRCGPIYDKNLKENIVVVTFMTKTSPLKKFWSHCGVSVRDVEHVCWRPLWMGRKLLVRQRLFQKYLTVVKFLPGNIS